MNTNSTSTELTKALAILARDSRNVSANIQSGVLYSQRKNWEKSVFHLKKALAGDKKNPLILEKLVDILVSARLAPQARKYARKLVELKGRDAAACHAMAKVFGGMGDLQKALYWIDLAVDREPENIIILDDKANYLAQAGDLEQSLAVHHTILSIDPSSTHSWWPVAQLHKYEGEDAKNTIQQIYSAIEKSQKKDDLRALHFAAGKIQQDDKKYEEAFGHFEKANTLHDQKITADRIIATNINICETYSKELFDSILASGNQTYKPVFILGLPRSGTTLTESLCASHSKITAGGELVHISRINNNFGLYSIQDKKHHNHIHDLTFENIQKISKELISKNKHLTRPGTRLTDTTPNNFKHIGLIAILFPNAQIIHCRRHPLDNCLSIFSNPMPNSHREYKSKLDVLGEYYRNYVQIMDHWREVCPIPVHDVFYEDLVTNTEAVARRMINHFGLGWEDNVMTRSGSQKAVKTLSVWQVRQPVFQTSKSKWRNYEKQLEPLRENIGTHIDDYEKELAALDANQEQIET